jgi:hypothetical protein
MYRRECLHAGEYVGEVGATILKMLSKMMLIYNECLQYFGEDGDAIGDDGDMWAGAKENKALEGVCIRVDRTYKL